MKKAMQLVAQWHHAFGMPIKQDVGFPDIKRRLLRQRLITEEYEEYKTAEAENNFTEVADALGDLIVVICGCALEYGIDLESVLEEIQASNMSKLSHDGKPIYREDGKVMKGPYFFKPDVNKALHTNCQTGFPEQLSYHYLTDLINKRPESDIWDKARQVKFTEPEEPWNHKH